MKQRKILIRKENEEIEIQSNATENQKAMQADFQVREQIDMVTQKENNYGNGDSGATIISTTGRAIKENQLHATGVGTRPKISLKSKADSERQAVTTSSDSISNEGRVKKRRLKFDDKYQRITTYLENELHDTVMELKETGEIDSITSLINAAVEEYIKKHIKI